MGNTKKKRDKKTQRYSAAFFLAASTITASDQRKLNQIIDEQISSLGIPAKVPWDKCIIRDSLVNIALDGAPVWFIPLNWAVMLRRGTNPYKTSRPDDNLGEMILSTTCHSSDCANFKHLLFETRELKNRRAGCRGSVECKCGNSLRCVKPQGLQYIGPAGVSTIDIVKKDSTDGAEALRERRREKRRERRKRQRERRRQDIEAKDHPNMSNLEPEPSPREDVQISAPTSPSVTPESPAIAQWRVELTLKARPLTPPLESESEQLYSSPCPAPRNEVVNKVAFDPTDSPSPSPSAQPVISRSPSPVEKTLTIVPPNSFYPPSTDFRWTTYWEAADDEGRGSEAASYDNDEETIVGSPRLRESSVSSSGSNWSDGPNRRRIKEACRREREGAGEGRDGLRSSVGWTRNDSPDRRSRSESTERVANSSDMD